MHCAKPHLILQIMECHHPVLLPGMMRFPTFLHFKWISSPHLLVTMDLQPPLFLTSLPAGNGLVMVGCQWALLVHVEGWVIFCHILKLIFYFIVIVTVLNPSVQPEKSLHGRCSTITVLVIIFLLSIIGGLSYKHWELIKENKQLKFMVGESHGEGKELNWTAKL